MNYKYAMGFVVYAVLMNVLDGILIPAVLAYFRYPTLGVVALFLDLDWLTYPLYFVIPYVWQYVAKY